MKKILPILLFLITFPLFSQYEAAFQARKTVLYDIIMNKYYCGTLGSGGFQPCDSRPPGYSGITSGDPFQYMGPKMAVIYEREGNSGTTNSDLANTKMTDHLSTFSLFHFNYPGLVKILMAFPTNPAVLATKQDWIQNMFNRTDSYSAFYGEGTENHLMMSRLPAYVLCELAIDSFPGDFPNAVPMRDSLKNYIMQTSKRMYSRGIGEFNSATYEGFSISGWLVVYDHAKDTEVKAAAKAALDYYALELALHHSQGIAAGGDMRGKGVTTSLSIESSLAWVSWVWYGNTSRDPYSVSTNFNKPTFVQSYYAAASSYRPPLAAVKLAEKKLTIPATYYNSKGSYLLDNPSYIKQTLYLDKSFALGATYFPYGGWAGGDWQMVNWKMISRVDSSTSKNIQMVSGQGMTYYFGGNYRTPFDQFAHHNNVMIQMTRVPSDAATIKSSIQTVFQQWANDWDDEFIQRFSTTDTKFSVNGGLTASSGRKTPVSFQNPAVTSGDSYMDIIANSGTLNVDNNTTDKIFYAELDKTYLAIRTIKNDNPSYSAGKLTDASAIGNMSGFIMEVRNKSDYASFTAFKTDVKTNSTIDKSKVVSEKRIIYTSTLGDVINVQYQSSGTFTEPIYDWGFGPTSKLVLQKEPPFQQPYWPSGEGHGKIASWTVNGSLVDLSQNWAVYEGPHASIKNNTLTLSDATSTYKVDYTGNIPIFDYQTDIKPTNEEKKSDFSKLVLYPNPASDAIYIQNKLDFNSGIKYVIYTIDGKKVKEDVLYSNKIELTDLNSGIYLIKINNQKPLIANFIIK
jgi:hypothetical protein